MLLALLSMTQPTVKRSRLVFFFAIVICREVINTVFDLAEKIDDDLLVDFANFSMDLGLLSIEGLTF